jgi:hypothetical protein
LRPELRSCPTRRAADLGVATADIAEAARIATTGDYCQRLAKLNLAERQFPFGWASRAARWKTRRCCRAARARRAGRCRCRRRE